MGQLRPAANECNRGPLVPTNQPHFGAGLICFQLGWCETIRGKQDCKIGTISVWFLLHYINIAVPSYFFYYCQYVDLILLHKVVFYFLLYTMSTIIFER